MKYKLKYLNIKKLIGGASTPEYRNTSAEIQPTPSSDLKIINKLDISDSQRIFKIFDSIFKELIKETSHTSDGLYAARLISDIKHDMDSRTHKINDNGLKDGTTSKILWNNFIEENRELHEILRKYSNDETKIIKKIGKYHGDSAIDVSSDTSMFSIKNFMNLDVAPNYYLSVKLSRGHKNPEIGIIDKGSETSEIRAGYIWADGNVWPLDGLKELNIKYFLENIKCNYLTQILKTFKTKKYDIEDNIRYIFLAMVRTYFEDKLKLLYIEDQLSIENISFDIIENKWYVFFKSGKYQYRFDITDRGSSTNTYSLNSIYLYITDLELEESYDNIKLDDLGSIITNNIEKNNIIHFCNIICILSKAFGDASYKIFISAISIYYVETNDVEVLNSAVVSQDRQLVRDLIKTFLVISYNRKIKPSIYFRIKSQQKMLSLLTTGSGYIDTPNFFTNILTKNQQSKYVVISLNYKHNLSVKDPNFNLDYNAALYELLRIIFLSSYGQLRQSAAQILDSITSYSSFPPRQHLVNETYKYNIDNILLYIDDIIEHNIDIFEKYKKWMETLSGNIKSEDDFNVKIKQLFNKSIKADSNISLLDLLDGTNIRKQLQSTSINNAEQLTLEILFFGKQDYELWNESKKIINQDNNRIIHAYLLLNNWIDYERYNNLLKYSESTYENIANNMSRSRKKIVYANKYLEWLNENELLSLNNEIIESFILNIVSSQNPRIFTKNNTHMREKWFESYDELLEKKPSEFYIFFINLIYALVEKSEINSQNKQTLESVVSITKLYKIDTQIEERDDEVEYIIRILIKDIHRVFHSHLIDPHSLEEKYNYIYEDKEKNQIEDNKPLSPAQRIKKDINDRISNNLISFTEQQEQNQIEEQQPLSPAQRIKEDMYNRNYSAVSPEQIDASYIEHDQLYSTPEQIDASYIEPVPFYSTPEQPHIESELLILEEEQELENIKIKAINLIEEYSKQKQKLQDLEIYILVNKLEDTQKEIKENLQIQEELLKKLKSSIENFKKYIIDKWRAISRERRNARNNGNKSEVEKLNKYANILQNILYILS